MNIDVLSGGTIGTQGLDQFGALHTDKQEEQKKHSDSVTISDEARSSYAEMQLKQAEYDETSELVGETSAEGDAILLEGEMVTSTEASDAKGETGADGGGQGGGQGGGGSGGGGSTSTDATTSETTLQSEIDALEAQISAMKSELEEGESSSELEALESELADLEDELEELTEA